MIAITETEYAQIIRENWGEPTYETCVCGHDKIVHYFAWPNSKGELIGNCACDSLQCKCIKFKNKDIKD